MHNPPLFGAIEAGGTKFVCGIGDASGRLVSEQRFPTTGPRQTLERVSEFLRDAKRRLGPMTALGLASFGPIELRKDAARYGRIGSTPKTQWCGFDIVGAIAAEFDGPIGFDTDVNAAALAEHRWGVARDVADLVYITVGTGIGGGALIGGKPLHGMMHPEMGHAYPRKHPLDQGFEGVCPFHGDCLEGLASGTAIRARSGASLAQLDDDHPQWGIQADYLGQLCALLVTTLSPQRIILGGGVMSQSRLLPPIRQSLRHWLHGYIDQQEILTEAIDHYVVGPALGANAGVLGALTLAIDAAARTA